MQHEFWKDKWAAGTTGFHLPQVHPDLLAFGAQTFGVGGRIIVPLCGKTRDLLWIEETLEGEALGVEFVEQAARGFFAEAGRAPEVTGTRWRSGRISIRCDSIYDVDLPALRPTGIWDRAALIALDPAERHRYTDAVRACLDAGAVLLLSTLEYDPSVMGGPPFTVDEDTVRQIYHGFDVELLRRSDILTEEPEFADRGHTWLNVVTLRVRQPDRPIGGAETTEP